MNKKMWFLSTGLIPIAIAPIATVISCGQQNSSILENFKFTIISNIQANYTDPDSVKDKTLQEIADEIKTKFSNPDLGFLITKTTPITEENKNKVEVEYKIWIGKKPDKNEPIDIQSGKFTINIPLIK